MNYDMMNMLAMNEQEDEQQEFDCWLDKAQRREELINKIDLDEINMIATYWKPTEAVRCLSNILTAIVRIK